MPTILFGAFDRHNFGDLLFPHIAAALLDRNDLLFAGLAERDLRRYGGHKVVALARLAASRIGHPLNIIHAGGELLTCDAWEAAVMLLPARQAHACIAQMDARPREKMAWAHGKLGTPALAPYSVSRRLFPHADRVIYNAVGGVDLGYRDAALRAEVFADLHASDAVGVRDRHTQALLAAEGIAARLMPDPAVMVAELFAGKICQRAKENAVAQVLRAFPDGYIAVQFSAGFGDDETLAMIAVQLDRIAASRGCGVVLFRAGAAPWHDDLSCYRRLAARMHSPAMRIFDSLNLWDICALIACSRAYAGSSLHGRIVAMAFGLPRINIRHPQTAPPGKQAAFASTWEQPGTLVEVDVHRIAQGIDDTLSADRERLRQTATELAARYREQFAALCARLP